MWTDEIVKEVRRQREAHAAKFNYDLNAMYQDLKAQEQRSQRKVVSLAPKRPVRIMLKLKASQVSE